MKTGSKVVLTKDIPYDYNHPETGERVGGVVKAATEGEVAGIVVIKGEEIVLFNPLDTTEIYAVSIHSVKKTK